MNEKPCPWKARREMVWRWIKQCAVGIYRGIVAYQERRALLAMPDHILHDMGITRRDLLSGSAWKAAERRSMALSPESSPIAEHPPRRRCA
jgi:hypothetical protein